MPRWTEAIIELYSAGQYQGCWEGTPSPDRGGWDAEDLPRLAQRIRDDTRYATATLQYAEDGDALLIGVFNDCQPPAKPKRGRELSPEVLAEPRQPICGRCGYDLRGLPAIHTCPECGLAYDAHSRVFHLYGRRRGLGDAIGGLVVVAGVFWTLIRGRHLQDVDQMWPVLLLLLAFPAIYIVRILYTTPRWLVLDRDGIHLHFRRRRPRMLFWSAYADAKVDPKKQMMEIRATNNAQPIQLDFVTVGGGKSAESIIREIERLRTEYLVESPPSAPFA